MTITAKIVKFFLIINPHPVKITMVMLYLQVKLLIVISPFRSKKSKKYNKIDNKNNNNNNGNNNENNNNNKSSNDNKVNSTLSSPTSKDCFHTWPQHSKKIKLLLLSRKLNHKYFVRPR